MAASVGGSVDRGGVSLDVGVRRDLAARLAVGVSLEYGPWVDVLSGSVQLGTASLSLTGLFRWVSLPALEVRSSLSLGATVLLFDLLGPHAGAVGPAIEASVVSVATRLGRGWLLEIKPDLLLLVPQARGTPLVYHEYRLCLGLEHRF